MHLRVMYASRSDEGREGERAILKSTFHFGSDSFHSLFGAEKGSRMGEGGERGRKSNKALGDRHIIVGGNLTIVGGSFGYKGGGEGGEDGRVITYGGEAHEGGNADVEEFLTRGKSFQACGRQRRRKSRRAQTPRTAFASYTPLTPTPAPASRGISERAPHF